LGCRWSDDPGQTGFHFYRKLKTQKEAINVTAIAGNAKNLDDINYGSKSACFRLT
jgi:hypothetical protein